MSRRAVARRAAALVGLLGVLVGAAGCSGGSDSGAATEQETSGGPTASATSGSADVGAPAASQIEAHRPTALTLPSGRVVRVDTSATGSDGALAIPADIDRAGWWDGSARLGDPFGGIVVAAHVDSFEQGLGRFAELLDVQRGDEITVTAGRLRQPFRIVSADLVPKAQVDSDADIYSVRGGSRLVLITCGGAYDQDDGGYQDNLVVIARPAGRLDSGP